MLVKDINDGPRISNAPSKGMVLLLDGYLNNEPKTKDNYLWGLKGLAMFLAKCAGTQGFLVEFENQLNPQHLTNDNLLYTL